jgi:hypothetical protein
MLPRQLEPGDFKDYPPEARQMAIDWLPLLRELPLSFVPLLLEEASEYDWKFPAEQKYLDHQFTYLASLTAGERRQVLAGFTEVRLSSEFERLDWVKTPGDFAERLSAYLWASGQIDAFRTAAAGYIQKLNAAVPPATLAAPRLGIAVIGQGVTETSYPLFRKLRPHGVYFNQVGQEGGLRVLLDAVAARAARYPAPYGHWYIEGGPEQSHTGSLACISYGALEPVRAALLRKMNGAINGGIGGPEALRTMLHNMRPEEIGLSGRLEDAVMSHFTANVLTNGSGTQIFSTTFVQWGAREALRRAQPLTLLAHFAPRQRQRPMNDLLSGKNQNPAPDPAGSLIDADMGAYLIWIDQQRLQGGNRSSFLVWFENHNQALVISPTLPRHTESNTPVDLNWLLAQVT